MGARRDAAGVHKAAVVAYGEGWANLARGEGGRPRGCVVLCLRCGAESWVVEGVPSRVVYSDLYDQSLCLVSVVERGGVGSSPVSVCGGGPVALALPACASSWSCSSNFVLLSGVRSGVTCEPTCDACEPTC